MSTRKKVSNYRQELLLLAYYAAMLIAGLAGFVRGPSATVYAVLEHTHWVYSGGMVAFSVTAVLAVARNLRPLEIVSLVVMAGLSILHGVMIFLTTGPGGDQMAWRIVASAIGCIVIACQRRDVWISRSELEQTLDVLVRSKGDE